MTSKAAYLHTWADCTDNDMAQDFLFVPANRTRYSTQTFSLAEISSTLRFAGSTAQWPDYIIKRCQGRELVEALGGYFSAEAVSGRDSEPWLTPPQYLKSTEAILVKGG